jgi:hypothetical protein
MPRFLIDCNKKSQKIDSQKARFGAGFGWAGQWVLVTETILAMSLANHHDGELSPPMMKGACG